MVFLIIFSNCGGSGGGGVVIPISMYFFGFSEVKAIALSNASLTVAAIVRYIQNFNKPHPLKNGKGVLVDYSVSTLMLPAIVIGVSVGVIADVMLSAVITMALLPCRF